jgi:hypothetical protein
MQKNALMSKLFARAMPILALQFPVRRATSFFCSKVLA